MADSPIPPNTLRPDGSAPSTDMGDVPDALRRRYLTENARWGGGLDYYAGAAIAAPSFRDRGRELIAMRSDPNTVRDLVAIAQHRGWTHVRVRGASGFRREVWLATRVAGLEVDGHHPTERDRQELARRLERQARHQNPDPTPASEIPQRRGRQAVAPPRPSKEDWHDLVGRLAARSGGRGPRPAQAPETAQRREQRGVEAPGPGERLRIVETVLRDRVADPDARARILGAARRWISELLERGARFDRLQAREARRRAPERQR